MVKEKIDGALGDIRHDLAVDGFHLTLLSVEEDGTITVQIEAGKDACIDCLVPDSFLTSMIEKAIRPVHVNLKKVNLLKKI